MKYCDSYALLIQVYANTAFSRLKIWKAHCVQYEK